MSECKCSRPPFDYRDYDSRFVGEDETNNRYAAVTVETCRFCGARWLNYLVEIEEFTRSGRWYRALVSETLSLGITPETAVATIANAEICFAGGSYFGSTGVPHRGPIQVDLFGPAVRC